MKDPIMEGVLLETETMLARGRMDLPLTLCFAALRGDDLLLHHLLKRGLDANESDNNGRTALHIAASKGNENCVLLLLDSGADPNSRDSEGSVPLWEAMLGGHKSVTKLLSGNGAKLTNGDIGQFLCIAAGLNNLDLLKEVVRRGGDVGQPKQSGSSSALHIAICEGNVEIVKYLLDQGVNIETPDENGWTPLDLADQQGHEEIKQLLESYDYKGPKIDHPTVMSSDEGRGVRFLGRFKSEPTILPLNRDGSFMGPDGSWSRSRPRRRNNSNFHNSLFGIMTAAQSGGESNLISPVDKSRATMTVGPVRVYAARVTVSCPDKGDIGGKLVLLPHRFEELLEICVKKFGFLPAKVLSRDGAEIDDIELLRDGDHIIFTGGDRKIDKTSDQQ